MSEEPKGHGRAVSRRHALGRIGILGSAPLLACGSDDGVSPDADATLRALTITDAMLSPAFASGVAAYTSSVANVVSSVTVTATATQSGATIAVNSAAVSSGVASPAVALDIGTNAVTIVVTAANGTNTRAYAVTITRAGVLGANCVLVPSETEGPYPLPDALNLVVLVRSDVREDRTGVPLTLMLAFVNVNQSCEPIAGAAVYIWHCDKDGAYSGYNTPANGNHLNETFLRGTHLTDANGQVVFTTIYPGWYPGRITHIHFQVYLNNNRAVPASATSQIAFPQASTAAVYDSPLYAVRGQNTSVPNFAADDVFADGTEFQLATVAGSVSNGYTAALTVGVAV
jgi:protocatechuate 3,4-dioxygenase beta subunit